MTNTIRMDRSGRLVIPQRIREKYGIAQGSHELEVLESVDGILLRPSVKEIQATRHATGWVVFHSDAEETVDPVHAVAAERESRLRRVKEDDKL